MVPCSRRLFNAVPGERDREPCCRSHPPVSQQIRSLANTDILRTEDARSFAGGVAPATDHTVDDCRGGEGALLVGMVAVGALRHAFWVQCINLNEWNWELTIIVAVGNNWIDFTHAKCLLKRLAEFEGNDGGVGSLAWIGVVLFVIGGVLETHSERQRRKFKDDPSSKGRLYTEGLFAHARHINYFGYILWRTGLGFVSGPPYTLSYGVYHAIDFYIRAIPLLQNHMQSKYGDQWTEYTKQTRSALIPGIL